MNHRTFITMLLLISTLGFHDLAIAVPVTIDFNVGSGIYSTVPPGGNDVYTEDGFTFATPLAPGNHFDSGPSGLGCCLNDLIFHEAASNTVNNVVTLSFGGAAFDIFSFDLVFDAGILAFNPLINPEMLVTASDGRTLLTPTAPRPGFIGTVVLNWENITSATFDITTNSTVVGNVVMDNVLLDTEPTAFVPEPSTLMLMGIGLVGLGWMGRRRQKT